MRRGGQRHCWFQEKNPFLGEGRLVFAAGDPPEGAASGPTQPPTEHELIQAGPKRMEMGELVELYPSGDTGRPLKEALDTYQILRGGMDYMDRINRYLQTSTETVDVGRLPWSQSGEKIQEAVRNLEAQVKGLRLNVDPNLFTTIRNSEEQEQRQQMIQVLAAAYERMNERANQEAQRIHELYVQQYIREYDELSRTWAKAPPVYADYAKYKQAQYKEAQDHLKKQLDIEIPLGDEDQLINVLQTYKSVFDKERQEYETARIQVEQPVDLSGLQKSFRKVLDKKATDFASRHGVYKSKINDILAELNRLESEINASDLDPTEKESRIGKIKKLRDDYHTNVTQSDRFAANNFSDSSPMTEKNEAGEDVLKTVTAADGTQVQMPQGLRDRMDMILSNKLSPDAINVLATGITEEITALNRAMDGFIRDADHSLDATLNGLRSEDVNGPITTPQYTMDFEVVWMSPFDVWKMVENGTEAFKRSFDRTRTRKVGKVGSALAAPLEHLNFGPFKHFSVIPGDLNKQQTQAENAAVDFYQTDYKSNDDNSLISLLHTARNQDQLKACIQLLAERGRLNWFDPAFLEQINRFQNAVHFDTSQMERFHANTPVFHKSLARAFEAIYGDADFFRNNNAQTQSNYNSGKEKFKQELINMARSPGGLQKLAVEMLREHLEAGSASKVNPQKFEYVIELGVIEGAVQPAESGLYFLIQAAASGLLPFERLQFLYANKANDVPFLEVFNEGIFNRQKLMQWASIDPPPGTLDALARSEVPHKFMRWFHTFVMHNPRVRARSAKVISGGRSMDSDLVTLFLPYASEHSATNILQVAPNGSHAEEWVLNNASQYQLLALHNQLEHMDEMDAETEGKMDSVNSKSELQNMIASFVKWDSVMESRMFLRTSQRYVRWTDTLKKQPPRSPFVNGFFWDGNAKEPSGENTYSTTYGYAVQTRNIITKLDPQLFGLLFGQGEPSAARIEEIKKIAREKYQYDFDGKPPQSADELYQGIAGLIGVVIERQSVETGTLKSLIREIKSQHKQVEKTSWEPIHFYPTINEKGEEEPGLSESAELEPPSEPAEDKRWHF